MGWSGMMWSSSSWRHSGLLMWSTFLLDCLGSTNHLPSDLWLGGKNTVKFPDPACYSLLMESRSSCSSWTVVLPVHDRYLSQSGRSRNSHRWLVGLFDLLLAYRRPEQIKTWGWMMSGFRILFMNLFYQCFVCCAIHDAIISQYCIVFILKWY